MPLESLGKILDSGSKISLCDNQLIIVERQNSSGSNSLEKIVIEGIMEEEYYAHKLDSYKTISTYFNGSNKDGINQGIDAFLVNVNVKQKFIFLIELKSQKVKETEVANKFFASYAFIYNIGILIKNTYNQDIFDYNSAAVLFALNKNNNRLKKFGMRPDMPVFRNVNYNNSSGKSIQVLEIKKNNGRNFNVSIQKMINSSRTKKFRTWLS